MSYKAHAAKKKVACTVAPGERSKTGQSVILMGTSAQPAQHWSSLSGTLGRSAILRWAYCDIPKHQPIPGRSAALDRKYPQENLVETWKPITLKLQLGRPQDDKWASSAGHPNNMDFHWRLLVRHERIRP